MPFALPAKDPSADKEYGLDWTPWLNGDAIRSSTWTQNQVSGSALVLSNPTFTNTATQVWTAGGNEGQTYVLINTIVTFGGRTETRRVTIRIKKQ